MPKSRQLPMYQHSRVRVQIGDRTHRADVADAGAWGWTSAGTCQEHTAGASVPRSQFDLHMGVAKAPWCNLHLLYTPCPCAVPIIPLPGIRLPGFAPRHRGAWFQRIRKKLCYRSQFVSSCRSYSLVRLSTSMEGGDVFLSGSCHTMSSSFAPQGVRSISRGGAPCVLILTCPVDTC